jgi:hypothetical protein
VRFAPHQLRHAHAVELAREGVPLIIRQRQLGHSNTLIETSAELLVAQGSTDRGSDLEQGVLPPSRPAEHPILVGSPFSLTASNQGV